MYVGMYRCTRHELDLLHNDTHIISRRRCDEADTLPKRPYMGLRHALRGAADPPGSDQENKKRVQ